MKLLIPCLLSLLLGLMIFAVTARAEDYFSREAKECLIQELGPLVYNEIASGPKELSSSEKDKIELCFSLINR